MHHCNQEFGRGVTAEEFCPAQISAENKRDNSIEETNNFRLAISPHSSGPYILNQRPAVDVSTDTDNVTGRGRGRRSDLRTPCHMRLETPSSDILEHDHFDSFNTGGLPYRSQGGACIAGTGDKNELHAIQSIGAYD